MMLKMPPKDLLDALNDNKRNIYVYVAINQQARCSIRVSYAEAMDWVIKVAKAHDGFVPYRFNESEVILGNLIYES